LHVLFDPSSFSSSILQPYTIFHKKIEFCNYPFENLLNVRSFVVFVVLEEEGKCGGLVGDIIGEEER